MNRSQLVAVLLRASIASLAVLAPAAGVSVVAPTLAPLVAIAMATAVVVAQVARSRAALEQRLHEIQGEVSQTEALVMLGSQLALRHPLPPMRGYAIAPDFALMLTTLIADERPELVVETGSGVSTLVAAYALEKLGRGRVVALEHDPVYAEQTRAQIALHGLGAYATVVDAPLETTQVDGEPHVWHALSALDGIHGIDLVIDDGPPLYLGKMLRYASLPIFAERLSPRGMLVLDVIGDEERTILERWKQRLPEFSQQHLATRKGNVILRREPRRQDRSDAAA